MSGGANNPGGMNPSPTGGTLTGFDVKLRRGQDPSLRSNRYMGGNGKAAGRACPAPTGCHKWVADERGKGGRQPAPLQWAGGCPLMGCRGRLRAAYMPPLQSCRLPLRGFGGTPDSKVEEGAGALRTKSNTAFV